MKNGFAFLYPPPRTVRFGGGSVDIRSVSFPLEIFKKYGLLFGHFAVRSRGRGVEVVFQERPGGSPARRTALGAEEYVIECAAARIVLSAASPRGRFYAISTLLQILAFHENLGRVPVFTLRDSPQVPFRGFRLTGAPAADLPRRLLGLALLKLNHLALPAALATAELASLARMAGLEISRIGTDPQALYTFAASADAPVAEAWTASGGEPADEAWLGSFLLRQRRAHEQGRRTAVWSDNFLRRPEWIRKIPPDVLLLQRDQGERSRFSLDALPLFRKHHLPQALCPTLGGTGRFLPDARAGLARVGAALAAAAGARSTGVLLLDDDGQGWAGLSQAAAMLHFQAGCLLWSGRMPGPPAFSRWALGRDEPDLFRVYSFLAQAEHQLPRSHDRYLFEDPIAAPYSRQDDPRVVVAHYQKAALYLNKRKVSPCLFSDFIDFTRRLYEFIAAKVEFSMHLGAFMEGGGPGREIALQAKQLRQALLELKRSFQELQAGHSPAWDRFDLLAALFERLGNEAYSSAARERLRSGLAAQSLDAPEPEALDGR
ncbi:MAG: glycoside hydrolase family 20 zincin-like fold domain-containing protein [Acidobacteria bacterium]|jgi:hypothetical protein|nr:glycoside hydrolase family 20 zincin-like fold domain-containing protein [Acidobacteriota bacterium]